MPRRPKNPNETPEERFKRLAELRTQVVIRRVRILGNCSNPSVYNYTNEQVEKIFLAIEHETRRAKEKFEGKTKPPEFKL